MKFELDIQAQDPSVRDFLTVSFLNDVNSTQENELSGQSKIDENQEGLRTRDGLITLIVEVLGGILTLAQLAELIYKHFISKGVDVKITNEKGDEISLSGNDDLVNIIEQKLKQIFEKN